MDATVYLPQDMQWSALSGTFHCWEFPECLKSCIVDKSFNISHSVIRARSSLIDMEFAVAASIVGFKVCKIALKSSFDRSNIVVDDDDDDRVICNY